MTFADVVDVVVVTDQPRQSDTQTDITLAINTTTTLSLTTTPADSPTLAPLPIAI